jgi:hypothetical protein
MTQPKPPPPGVETAPQGPVVPLKEAAARLGKDSRTIIRAIKEGTIRGGVEPRQERHRWYVYVDELPEEPVTMVPVAVVEELRAQVDSLSQANRRLTAGQDELRAQNVSLKEANRLLIASQQELLEVDQAMHDVVQRYRSIAQRNLDALGQFHVPGNIGDLADL